MGLKDGVKEILILSFFSWIFWGVEIVELMCLYFLL